MSASTPVTPAKKIRSSPTTTPRKQLQLQEDKILVTVRVRPLTPRELASYDLIAWDSPDDNTLVSRNLNRHNALGTYNFGIFFVSLRSIIWLQSVGFCG